MANGECRKHSWSKEQQRLPAAPQGCILAASSSQRTLLVRGEQSGEKRRTAWLTGHRRWHSTPGSDELRQKTNDVLWPESAITATGLPYDRDLRLEPPSP